MGQYKWIAMIAIARLEWEQVGRMPGVSPLSRLLQ
jgi:hypothetical protein